MANKLQDKQIQLSYQRLRSIGVEDDDVIGFELPSRKQSWLRLRRVSSRRRSRLRIPSLRRFIKKRVRYFRVSWSKVLKRLKESGPYLGDLFVGNYMFMQVNPTAIGYLEKACKDQNHGYHLSKVA